mgnify:CR=1 FL=1
MGKRNVNADHRHVQFSKRNTGAIVQKLPDFYSWDWIMKVVLKVWSECSFLEDSILQDDLQHFLGSVDKEKTLQKLIEIVKLKAEIDGD